MFDSITFIWGTIIGVFTCFIYWGFKRGEDNSKYGWFFYMKKYWYCPLFWIPVCVIAIGVYY